MPYDKTLAAKAIEWFPRYLKHTKGRWFGVPFELLPWQVEVAEKLFGTIKDDGSRQYKRVYIEIPKKQGKSEFAAGLAAKLLFADGEAGAEIYSAAADHDQAAIVFNVAAEMVRNSPKLAQRSKIIDSTKRIFHNNGGFYRVLSADAHTKHGFNVSGVIFDELHAQPNRELWDVLTMGSGAARRQPVYFAITTAGYDRHSICWEIHEYARKVRDGIIIDPSFLPVLYYADDDDDWTNEEVWKKCNPSLGVTCTIEDMREECKMAQETPALENTFRRLHLNQWVKQESRFIPMKHWDACPISEDLDLDGETFYAGLDLASTTDIAAFVLLRIDDEGFADVIPHFWIPEDSMRDRSRRDGVPYEQWVKQSLIHTTPGNSTDYKFIYKAIQDLLSQYHIAEIAYDPWNSAHLVQELTDDGATMVPIIQGPRSFNSATKELLTMVLAHKVRHNENPVLRWMADNMVVKTDSNANLKPDKEKSTEKIDGIVAMIMALDRAARHAKDGASIYENEELLIL